MMKTMTMRVAAVLLPLAIATTSFVGGTMAKYTTTTTGGDNARVAYWGFTEDTATYEFRLFAESYDAVQSDVNGVKVVAPGTSGSASFNFEYKDNGTDITAPETDYMFTVDAVESGSHTGLAAIENFDWTLKWGSLAEVSFETLADLVSALDAKSSARITAGSLPNGFDAGDNTVTIGWTWQFNDNTATKTISEQDKADTALGNAETLEDLGLTITITATQLDTVAETGK